MRLRSVMPSTPKPLATIGGMPFLELLVRQLRYQGFRRVVMCTGYLAEQVENRFGDGHEWDIAIEYSKEPSPLGTAGALKLARPFLRGTADFLVMNGDSFLDLDFQRLLRFHRERGGVAAMAVRQVSNASRYGTVRVDAASRVVGFAEKTGTDTNGLVNAGVYVFNRSLFDYIPEGPASLERDVMPQLIDRGLYALEQHGIFIDIGTPEDYALAQSICDRLCEAAFHRESPRSAGKRPGLEVE